MPFSSNGWSEEGRQVRALATDGDPYWAEQVGIQEDAANAWIALGEKKIGDAVTSMESAADREDRSEKHVAMENRLSPMRELYGELLLEAGKPQEALEQFEHALERSPNRVRSLDGAARAAQGAGEPRNVIFYYRKLVELTSNADPVRPLIRGARARVNGGR